MPVRTTYFSPELFEVPSNGRISACRRAACSCAAAPLVGIYRIGDRQTPRPSPIPTNRSRMRILPWCFKHILLTNQGHRRIRLEILNAGANPARLGGCVA